MRNRVKFRIGRYDGTLEDRASSNNKYQIVFSILAQIQDSQQAMYSIPDGAISFKRYRV